MEKTLVSYKGHFDSLLPRGKQWFSPKEVGAIIGKTDQYIRNAFDNQKILGHCSNARADRKQEKRRNYQIARANVILFLLETANYTPQDFMEHLLCILRNQPRKQLIEVYDAGSELLKL